MSFFDNHKTWQIIVSSRLVVPCNFYLKAWIPPLATNVVSCFPWRGRLSLFIFGKCLSGSCVLIIVVCQSFLKGKMVFHGGRKQFPIQTIVLTLFLVSAAEFNMQFPRIKVFFNLASLLSQLRKLQSFYLIFSLYLNFSSVPPNVLRFFPDTVSDQSSCLISLFYLEP